MTKNILMLKKTDYWLDEALTIANRFSSLMEETTEEATALHTEPKPLLYLYQEWST